MQVRFENVVKRYGDVTAVKPLNLTIPSGALHFLLGPSGCGKTTTLRMLAGLEAPTSGKIYFDNIDVTEQPAAERGIGMVFQNYALWPHMTVLQNIEYGLKLRKIGKSELEGRIREVLEFTQLSSYAERLPGQLSGGQQQRVALARALAIRPNVLLLDEPLSNLDAKLRLEMRENITRIHKKTGITTVYVTHDQKEALSMGTNISVMRAGDLIQTDTPRRLYRDPATPFIAGFIGETNLLAGKVEADRGSAGLTVRTGVGLFEAARVAPQTPRQVGADVTLSLRPEAIKLTPSPSRALAAANSPCLVLEHLTYLGESEQLTLRGEDGSLLKAAIFNVPDHDHAEGTSLLCQVDAQDIVALPVEHNLRSGT